MSEDDIKILQQNCYCLGNSKFPLDKFFNDIRDNDSPNFDKNEAYEDLRLIVDFIYNLIDKDYSKKVNYRVEYLGMCPRCDSHVKQFYHKFCPECGQRLNWSL